MTSDIAKSLQEQVCVAAARRTPLTIVGGDSKKFYGRSVVETRQLYTADHNGIVAYEPSELFICARAGTKLTLIEETLAEKNQMLAFEPPHFGANATLGGTIACNLSGPRRPYSGAARDFVLGVEILNGLGERLRFGGQVMKNVAGYDVSRLMAGALGTLGVILEVTLKVLPKPQTSLTLRHEFNADEAITTVNHWAGKAYPISATCYDGDVLVTRLEGASSAVKATHAKLGGTLDAHDDFWVQLREQGHGFFQDPRTLWRICLPQATPMLTIPGKTLLEWGGGLRWLYSDANSESIRSQVELLGGHATIFRRGKNTSGDCFHPLNEALSGVHQKLKIAFDPHTILNPGRLYTNI